MSTTLLFVPNEHVKYCAVEAIHKLFNLPFIFKEVDAALFKDISSEVFVLPIVEGIPSSETLVSYKADRFTYVASLQYDGDNLALVNFTPYTNKAIFENLLNAIQAELNRVR